MKGFTDLQRLDDRTIEELLALAREVEAQPLSDALRGRVLGLLFMNPSLRTLTSFQSGMAQLGGSSFVITPGRGSWGFEVREGVRMDGGAAEHVKEAIPVLESYCDVLGVRAFACGEDLEEDLGEPLLARIEALSTRPLINMESAVDHPCQALADWKTLDDLDCPRHGGRFVLSWCWHPRALPMAVPAAVAAMAARRGMDVRIARPRGFALPAPVMERVRRAAARSGGSVVETEDLAAAVEGAHVIYAKSWGSAEAYGDPAAEAGLRAGLEDWCIGREAFEGAVAEAVFMHCLPVRRNVVVTDEVLDGPRSQVLRQAANRLHVQKALLLRLLGGV